MATHEAFFKLGVGIRFDKKKIHEESLRFAGGKCLKGDVNGSETSHSTIPDELDFFGTKSESGKSKDAKKPEKHKKYDNGVNSTKNGLEDIKRKKPKTNDSSSSKESPTDEGEENAEASPKDAKNEAKKREQHLEEINILRKHHRIHIIGEDCPDPIENFQDLETAYNLPSYLMRNIEKLGFKTPSPIQMQTIPLMLQSSELLACAPTGSGKTAAYLIPLLCHLKAPRKDGFRAVILSPTRELSTQIYQTCLKLTEGKKFKVVNLTKATASKSMIGTDASQRLDILITTPMRLVKMIQERSIELSRVEWLIMDEADKLFELGFVEQIDEIIAACHRVGIRRALFSATIPQGVEEMARSFLVNPIRVTVGSRNAATQDIQQKLVFVGREDGKLLAIRQQIIHGLKPPVIIFVQSIERAKELFHELIYDGIHVDVIHAERTQLQRDALIKNFRLGKIWVLIATDLMARGLDFKGVNTVINYDFPQTATSYIHRIGRTGRAGRTGEAVTFFTQDDVVNLRSIVNVMKESGCEVPDWMLNIKPASKKVKRKLSKKPIQRKTISTKTIYDHEKMAHRNQIISQSMHQKELSLKEKSA